MIERDLVQQPRKELPPDALALGRWMNGYCEVAQDVREDMQLTAVGVEFRGQAR